MNFKSATDFFIESESYRTNKRGHYGIDVSNYFSIVSKNAITFFPLAGNYLFWYIIDEWYYGATSLIRHLWYPTLMLIPIWPLMTMQFFLTHSSSTSIFHFKHDSYLSNVLFCLVVLLILTRWISKDPYSRLIQQ